jgi:opacity protein-like surface antigen
MKKLILITALLSSISSISFAKTEGSQIGFDLTHVNATYQPKVDGYQTDSNFKESKMGYGINFQHAFSLDNVFLAPELFVEKLGTKAVDEVSDSVTLNHRYGAKLNIGYDISDQFAIFGNLGATMVNYEVNWNSAGEKEEANKFAGIVGVGASYAVTKNVILSLKADFQKLDLDTPHNDVKVETEIFTTKLGIAYRF